MSIPVFFTPFRIVKTREGYRARWLPRTTRESQLSLDASPVMGSRERVRSYMAYVYADVIEEGTAMPQ